MPKDIVHNTERPPIVVIMGHIDHGKSTLLDYIRKSNIVETEAGGITQHISAYEVIHKDPSGKEKRVTFLDTPGHAAFQGMRSRGARVADIAILVVSAEDGVKAQTLEAYGAIKAAKIPYIVAINKIDKPNADVDRTKQSLAEAEIFLEGWGGDIPWAAISAKSGQGVPDLLDTLLLVAELESLVGDTTKPGEGVVIESNMDPKRGISATVVVTDGTFRKGHFAVAEDAYAPLRAIENFLGKPMESATFSSPVRIVGWSAIPKVGSIVSMLATKREAEQQISLSRSRPKAVEGPVEEEGVRVIPIVLKTDVVGTLEALEHEIGKLSHERVRLKIVGKGVGTVTEADIKILIGSDRPLVITFNTKADSQAEALSMQYDIPIHSFNIIYKLTEWLEEEMRTQAPKQKMEEALGEVRVIRFFSTQKDQHVVGGKVESGKICVGDRIKIVRRGQEIGTGEVIELQVQKIKTKEVSEEGECGMMIESKHAVAERDTLIPFRIVEK